MGTSGLPVNPFPIFATRTDLRVLYLIWMRLILQYLRVYHFGACRRLLGWLNADEAIHTLCPAFTILIPVPTIRYISSSTVATPIMSQTQSTAAASSRFQAIFDAALKSYQKQTKKDLLAHPLASQLQSCHSTSAILAVLQDQVQQFDKSQSGDERLTKWLIPTVNVLCAFSAVVSGGVGLVSLDA